MTKTQIVQRICCGILVLGFAGCSTPTNTAEPPQTESPPADLSSPLSAIQSLAEEVRIVFGRERPLKLRMPLETETGIEYAFVDGKGIVAESVEQEKTSQSVDFFRKYGFETRYVLDESPMHITGFQKENLICSVRVDDPDASNMSRLEIQCGQIDDGSKKMVNTTLQIKTLLAERYGVEATGIRYQVTKENEDYIRGTVTEGDEGSLADSFFVTKKDGPWKLFYAGDEPFPCEELKTAGFDDRMLQECATPTSEPNVTIEAAEGVTVETITN